MLSVGEEGTLSVFVEGGEHCQKICKSCKLTQNVVVKEWEGTVRVSAGIRRYVAVEMGALGKSFCLSRHLQSEYFWGRAGVGKVFLGQAGMV